MAEKKLTKKEKALICATVASFFNLFSGGVAGYFMIKYLKIKNKKK